jgi:hypothetical protein
MESLDANLSEGKVLAALPKERPLVYFLTVTDQRGAVASSEHAELAKP